MTVATTNAYQGNLTAGSPAAFGCHHGLLVHLPGTTINIITSVLTLDLLSFRLALYAGHGQKSTFVRLIANYSLQTRRNVFSP